MAVNAKKVGLYGTVGFLVAALIIGGIAVAGFQIPALKLPSMVSEKGRLVIQITDKPVELVELWLTIDGLSIRKAEGEEAWIELDLIGEEPIRFDLLALQDVSSTLSDNEIDPGEYTMIKMHVSTAEAKYPGDDSLTPLNKVPSENLKVILNPHLVMTSLSDITITIDLEPDTAKIAISESLHLKPTVKAVVG